MRKNLPQKQDRNNKQNLYIRSFSVGIMTVALSVSCSNTKPSISIDPLERNARSLVNTSKVGGPKQEITQAAIQAALLQYAATDNLRGQWRIHQLQTKLALQAGKQLKAESSLEQLSWLATQIDDQDIQYQTELCRGRVNQDNSAFRKALTLATTPLQAAIAHTYLGETKKAVKLIGTKTVNDERYAESQAFVYYQHAKHTSSKEHYLLALNAYKLAEDSRGIADVLAALAKLSYETNQSERAVIYARRAINILDALGESKKALGIRRWLSNWQLQ